MQKPALEPLRAQDIEGAGSALRVHDYGNESAPAMVLVHGIQDFALSLGTIAEAFRSEYHVVSFDLRGHGDSEKPGLYTMSHHLADLHSVLGALDLERPILLGHSLGGQIVSQYAGLFTEVPSCVINVEGLGPPMRDLEMSDDRKRRRARRSIESLTRKSGARRTMRDKEVAVGLFRSNHPRLGEAAARRLVDLGTEPAAEGGWRWKWDPRVQTTWLSFSTQVGEERWSWIECPVLLVTAGMAAEFWSRRRGIPITEAGIDREELARRIGLFRYATHVEIASAGHMVHYDAPEMLVDEIRVFLDREAGGRPVRGA